VRQVDQAHDAENQRQPRRHQKQHDAELNAVEHLLYEEVDLQLGFRSDRGVGSVFCERQARMALRRGQCHRRHPRACPEDLP
jgi:hypothetical protein